MTASWFNTADRRHSLLLEAASWRGTPFMPNGNTKGMGVSCQKLASEIYKNVGCCAVEVPEVPMSHARFSKESLLEPFMDARQEFERAWPYEIGDLLGFRLGRVIHHCGIYLGKGDFIHAITGLGTVCSSLADATWSMRHAATWRPKA
jgi:cell wall-associated NlpC family hydrolase